MKRRDLIASGAALAALGSISLPVMATNTPRFLPGSVHKLYEPLVVQDGEHIKDVEFIICHDELCLLRFEPNTTGLVTNCTFRHHTMPKAMLVG